MAHHVTGLAVTCDEAGCAARREFPNPDGDAFAVLERRAYEAGWYLHGHFGGPDLCPEHHRERSLKAKLETLYERPPDKGRPAAAPGVTPREQKVKVLPGQISFDGVVVEEKP